MTIKPGTERRQLHLDKTTKTKIENYAYSMGWSISEAVRTIVDELLAATELDTTDPGEVPSAESTRATFVIDDDVWAEFDDLAWRSRTSRSKLIRQHVATQLGAVPLNREKVVRK